jgi:hypothetical protein
MPGILPYLQLGQYSMAADSGSFTLAGTAAAGVYGRVFPTDSGAITLNGTAVVFTYTKPIVVDTTSFTLSGQALGLVFARLFAAASGSMALSGTAVVGKATRKCPVDTTSFSLTGTDIDLVYVSGLPFDDVRQDIIDCLFSCQSETNGWDAQVRPNVPVTAVVRTSDTVVTITLPAIPGYEVTTFEDIVCVIPEQALVSGVDTPGTPPVRIMPELFHKALACTSGSFSWDSTVNILYNPKIATATTSFTRTGTAVSLLATRRLNRFGGTLTLEDGNTRTQILWKSRLPVSTTSFSLTGTVVDIARIRLLLASPGSITLNTPNETRFPTAIKVTTTGFTLAGGAKNIRKTAISLQRLGRAFTYTGTAVKLSTAIKVTTTSFSLAGGAKLIHRTASVLGRLSRAFTLATPNAVNLLYKIKFPTATTSFTLTGSAKTFPVFRVSIFCVLESGVFALAGDALGFNLTRIMAAATGPRTLTGTAVALKYGKVPLDASSGALALTGSELSLNFNRWLSIATTAFGLLGTDADTLFGRVLDTASGGFSLAGADLIYVGRRDIFFEVNGGAYTTSDGDVIPYLGRVINPVTGVLETQGQDVEFPMIRVMLIDEGITTINGDEIQLISARIIAASSTDLTVTGTDIELLAGYSLLASSAFSLLAANALALMATRLLDAQPESMTSSGSDMDILAGRVINAYDMSFELSGHWKILKDPWTRHFNFKTVSGLFRFYNPVLTFHVQETKDWSGRTIYHISFDTTMTGVAKTKVINSVARVNE